VRELHSVQTEITELDSRDAGRIPSHGAIALWGTGYELFRESDGGARDIYRVAWYEQAAILVAVAGGGVVRGRPGDHHGDGHGLR